MLTPSIVTLARARWDAILNPQEPEEPEEPETPVEPLVGVLTFTGDVIDVEGTIYREYALTVDGEPVDISAANITSIHDTTRDVPVGATDGASVLRFSTEIAVGDYDLEFTLVDETVILATLTQDEYVPE